MPWRGGSSLQLSGGRGGVDDSGCSVLEHRSEVTHRPHHCKHDRTGTTQEARDEFSRCSLRVSSMAFAADQSGYVSG